MTKTFFLRRRVLTKRSLQLRLIASFVGMSMLALIIQFMMLGLRLSELAGEGASEEFGAELPAFLASVFAISFGVLLPLTVMVGIVTTFRIAGPIYRFEQYLGEVIRGEANGPCRIRKNDQLHDLCNLLNRGLEAARQQGREEAGRKDEQPELQEAA